MRLRTVLIASAVVAAVAGVAYCGHRRPKAEVVANATAERGTLTETVSVTGRVAARREVEIKCKASGAVRKLAAQESDRVKQGDLLADLDPSDEEREVHRYELGLAAAKARLSQARTALAVAQDEIASERRRAESGLSAATARSDDAAARVTRSEALLKKGLVSAEDDAAVHTTAAEVADALAAARQRIDDLRMRESALELKRQDIALAETQAESEEVVLSDARQRLADTRVVAPIDGVVATVSVAPGQIVSSGISTVGGGSVVMTMIGDDLEVLCQIDESYVAKVRPGQEAKVSAAAFPGHSWTGTISRIAAKGATRNNAVEFETRVALKPDAAADLRPEMTVEVAITIASATDVVLIPVDAVTWRKDKAYVRLAGGDEREITTGASDGQKLEVVKGLEAGATLTLPAKSASRWRREIGINL